MRRKNPVAWWQLNTLVMGEKLFWRVNDLLCEMLYMYRKCKRDKQPTIPTAAKPISTICNNQSIPIHEATRLHNQSGGPDTKIST